MRLKVQEHKDLLAVIQKQGIAHESFSFSKKRGLVHIHQSGREDVFRFYRKKETYLDENKQWKHIENYYRDLPHKGVPAMNWQDILKEFESWLKALK